MSAISLSKRINVSVGGHTLFVLHPRAVVYRVRRKAFDTPSPHSMKPRPRGYGEKVAALEMLARSIQGAEQ